MLLYAHRGASADAPENSLEAFRRGLELGADALELDVHLTRDGAVVVSHDPGGHRLAGVPRLIRECTLDEIREWNLGPLFSTRDGSRPFADRVVRVPTLDEVLVEFAGVPLNIDLKTREPALVPAAIAVIRQHRAQASVRLASFHASTLRRVRRMEYEGPTGLGREDVALLLSLPGTALRVLGWRGRAAQLPTHAGALRFDRGWFVRRCHAAGLRLDFWTINDPAQAVALAELGADGIMTDDPARIAPALRAQAGQPRN